MTGGPPRSGVPGGVADIAKVWKIAARVQQTRISARARPSPGWFEQTSRTRRYRDLGSGLAGGIIRQRRAPSRAGQALNRQEAEKRPVDQGHGADANSGLTAKPEVVKVEGLAMQRLKGIPLHMTVAALALAVAGCSSDLSLNNLTLVPKPETMMRKPDWAAISPGKTDFSLRPVTPADLVNADGVCAAATEQAAGFAEAAGSGPGAGGIALQMTECDVVRRAGAVEKIDVSADERGDRAVVLTYLRGPSAGVYRFVGGRLVSIERAPGPPPAPAKAQKAAPKKPAGT
jgi:hypothetical protein